MPDRNASEGMLIDEEGKEINHNPIDNIDRRYNAHGHCIGERYYCLWRRYGWNRGAAPSFGPRA